MNLDELKSTWQSLDERLKKQEILKKNMIREMLQTKTDKSLSKLITAEVIGLIVLLLIFPVLIFSSRFEIELPAYHIFMKVAVVIYIICIIWQAIKIYKLTRINLSKTLSNNVMHTSEYNIWIGKEKLTMLFTLPALSLGIAYIYMSMNVGAASWSFLICLITASTVYSYWSYKRIYDKNIKLILKSLEELKELDEE